MKEIIMLLEEYKSHLETRMDCAAYDDHDDIGFCAMRIEQITDIIDNQDV